MSRHMRFTAVLISIHAPRTGSDAVNLFQHQRNLVISIHAPRTGSDDFLKCRVVVEIVFQSTLPARGATSIQRASFSALLFQSTLPARGAT